MPYGETDQPLTDNLLDYLLPTISEMHEVVLEETETPNPNSLLGAKGAGEAACISAPPVIVNAVADALEDPGILRMPLTPQRVRDALQTGS